MNVEVQARDDGSLRFVERDRGTIAKLSYPQVAVLYGLSTASKMSPLRREVFFGLLRQPLVAGSLRANIETLKTAAPSGPLVFFADIGHLQALNLVAQPPRNPLLELAPVKAHTPLRLTKPGELLVDWLTTQWTGWAAYTQQFPL